MKKLLILLVTLISIFSPIIAESTPANKLLIKQASGNYEEFKVELEDEDFIAISWTPVSLNKDKTVTLRLLCHKNYRPFYEYEIKIPVETSWKIVNRLDEVLITSEKYIEVLSRISEVEENVKNSETTEKVTETFNSAKESFLNWYNLQ